MYAIRLYDRDSRFPYDDNDSLIAYIVFAEDAYIPSREWWDGIDGEITSYDPYGEIELSEAIRYLLDEGDLEYDYIDNPWQEDFDLDSCEVIDVPVRI